MTTVSEYIDRMTPEHRPLFDRLHNLILTTVPDVDVVLSYGIPTYRHGRRRLHLGVWAHGVSVYGWKRDADAGFSERHPDLLSGKATIRIRAQDAAQIPDQEFCALISAVLCPPRAGGACGTA